MAQDINEQSAVTPAGARAVDGGPVSELSADLQQHHAQMLDAAASIDQHLQQMASWKQQLARQMELLQQDGLKVLEQQKRLIEEEVSLKTQADTLAADRAALESQRAALADEQRVAAAALDTQRRELEGQRAELDGQRARIDAEMRRVGEREQAIVERELRLQQDQAAVAGRCEQFAAERQAIENRASDLQRMLADIEAGTARLEAEKKTAADALAQSEAALQARSQGLHQRESELAEALLLLGREAQRLHERRMELEAAGPSSEPSQDLSTLTAEKARLEARLAESDQRKRNVEARAAALAAQIEELTAQHTAADAGVSEAQARAAALAAQVEELAAQRVAAENRAGEAQAEAARSKARSTELETEKAAAAAQLAAAEARSSELVERATELETRNRAAVEEKAALASERAALSEQVSRLTVESTSVRADLARLTAERDAAVQKAAAAAQPTEQPSAQALETQATEWEKRATELSAERNALIAKAAALENERADLIEQHKRVEARMTALEQRCVELDAALKAAEQVGTDAREVARRLKDRNAQLEHDIRALQTRVDPARAEFDARVAAVADERDAQRQRAEMAAQYAESLQSALAEAQARLAAAPTSATGTAQDDAELGSSIREFQGEIARMRGRIVNLEAERDALTTRLAQVQGQLQNPQAALAPAPSKPELAGADLVQTQEDIGFSGEEFAQTEQTEQLLETQAPPIPRRPARFSAIKTLAAAALFALMVLGITVVGVYGFVSPVFRSEADVQLVPPGDMNPADVPAWLARQTNEIRVDADVLKDAWTQMREVGSSRYNSNEEWLAALPHDMDVKLDTAAKTMSVRMSGDSRAGLCAAANAVAAAYVDKATRLKTASTHPEHTGTAMLAVRATPAAITVTDRRMSLAALVSVAALLTGLLAVMVFRRALMKDLRAIDDMAGQCEEAVESQPS